MEKKKNLYVELFLCIFFGIFGVHKFYTGKKKQGFLYICTVGLFGIGVVFDLIRIIGSIISNRPKGYKAVIGALGLSLLMTMCSSDQTDQQAPETTAPTIIAVTEVTTAPETQQTTAPATEPPTEATTIPTTEATTAASTEAPTVAPTETKEETV